MTIGTASTGGADFKLTGTVALSGGVLQIGHRFPPLPPTQPATAGTVEFLGAAGGGLNGNGTYNFYNLQIDNGADPNLKGAANNVIKVAGTLDVRRHAEEHVRYRRGKDLDGWRPRRGQPAAGRPLRT